MGFNYRKEKGIFYREWERLRKQYEKEGIREEVIQKMYDFDWSWFCKRRSYENYVQALPEVEIDDENAITRSTLIKKFTSLSIEFDEMESSGRYDWIESISDDVLSKNLKDLNEEELELLTLVAIDGYTQREIARKMHCSQNAISKRLIRIKRILKEK